MASQSLYAERNTYNPKNRSLPWLLRGVCTHHVLSYRKDLWDAVGEQPKSWDDIRKGGRKIKLLHEKPVGISLAADSAADSNGKA